MRASAAPRAATSGQGMLKNASRCRFDVVTAWAIDRFGRSLVDLLETPSTSVSAECTGSSWR